MYSRLGNHGSKFIGCPALARRLQLEQKNSTDRLKTTTSCEHKYQYLHKSKLPTFYFQQSLPRLPIPELDKTCERYLAAVEPIISPESLHKTKSIVSEFSTGAGQHLQDLLKNSDAANKHTSYISQPWFDMYLSDRSPLPVNYNPLLIMKHDTKPEYNTQLIRSANLVISSLRFMRSLKANVLEPEVFHMNPTKSDNDRFRRITGLAPRAIATYVAYAFKAFPLDMSQYNRLFGVTRIPQIGKDRIYQTKEDSRHILVIRCGKFFAVDVMNAEGDIISPNLILGRLKAVIELNPSGEILDNKSLGVMTAANRDLWAKTRQYIIDIGNSKQMKLIDSALFCLALDGDGVKYDESEPQKLVKHFLAGDAVNRKKTTTKAQQELLVEILRTKIDVARNSTKRPAEEVANFWQNIANEVNALGPPIRDVNGWKKVWSDYKGYIKKKLADNKREVGATGGGPFTQKSFTPIEEAVISIINLKDSIDGIAERTFGTEPVENHSVTTKLSAKPTENKENEAGLNPEHHDEENSGVVVVENSGYVSEPEASAGHSTKRKPLSTTQLLNKQVNFQEDFYKEISLKLNATNQNLEDVCKNLKRVSRSLDDLCAIEKKKLKEVHDHNVEVVNIMNRKLQLKVQILEAQIEKTNFALNKKLSDDTA